jgi:uncharacterized sporulation protein YeaH/YhbH (DUF444 family)
MADMLFDTQKLVERLEEAGVPPSQARAHIAVLAEVIGSLERTIIERCASKQDLEELRCEIKQEIEAAKSDLMRWMLSVVVAAGLLQTTLVAALILKLLP